MVRTETKFEPSRETKKSYAIPIKKKQKTLIVAPKIIRIYIISSLKHLIQRFPVFQLSN